LHPPSGSGPRWSAPLRNSVVRGHCLLLAFPPIHDGDHGTAAQPSRRHRDPTVELEESEGRGALGHRSPSRPRLHSAPQKPCVGATVLGKYGARGFSPLVTPRAPTAPARAAGAIGYQRQTSTLQNLRRGHASRTEHLQTAAHLLIRDEARRTAINVSEGWAEALLDELVLEKRSILRHPGATQTF
jgi:hypothetical protein